MNGEYQVFCAESLMHFTVQSIGFTVPICFVDVDLLFSFFQFNNDFFTKQNNASCAAKISSVKEGEQQKKMNIWCICSGFTWKNWHNNRLRVQKSLDMHKIIYFANFKRLESDMKTFILGFCFWTEEIRCEILIWNYRYGILHT